jgi:poly(3-hydroxybutyrate) depolymerase
MRDYLPGLLHIILLFLLSTVLVNQTSAQEAKKYQQYLQAHYKGMRYGLFKPATYSAKKTYPLIVYLHGSTDTVSRDLIWYQKSVQKDNPCFVLSPKTTEPNQGWGNTWEKNHSPAMVKTLSLVDSLVKAYNIDRNRLYIYGISMGAFGVFSALSKEPQKFAGAYAVCGGSHIDAASKITTPLWIFHGSEDDVVPVRLSKNMYDAMVKTGNKKVRYTEYAGVKHNSWENVSKEKTLTAWLLAQQTGKIGDATAQVKNLTLKKQFNSTITLTWSKDTNVKSQDNEVWYYKIFRNNVLIGEADGDITEFNDYKYNNESRHAYHVVAVGYLFNESQPSNLVRSE